MCNMDKGIVNTFGFKYNRFLVFKRKFIRPNRFVHGSTYKFSKFHKLISPYVNRRLSTYSISSRSPISYGSSLQFVVSSTKFLYMKDYQLKSFKNLLKKPYKYAFEMNVSNSYYGVTKKPAEVRMGKGKGSKVAYRVSLIRPGLIFGSSFRSTNTHIVDYRILGKFKALFSKLPMGILLIRGSF